MTINTNMNFNFKGIINKEGLESLGDSSCIGDIYWDAENGEISYVFDGKSFVALESSSFGFNVSNMSGYGMADIYQVIQPTSYKPNASLEDYYKRVQLNKLEEERENLIKEILSEMKFSNSLKKSKAGLKSTPNLVDTLYIDDAIEKLNDVENQISTIKEHINSNLNIVLDKYQKYRVSV